MWTITEDEDIENLVEKANEDIGKILDKLEEDTDMTVLGVMITHGCTIEANIEYDF